MTAAAARPLDLRPLLDPASIAVIGASNDPRRVSGMPLHFLTEVGYPGAIYPINSARAEVQGRRAYASIADVEGDVDLAIVALGAEQVQHVAEECAAAGVRSLVVFSSGFAEIGPEGAERQAALTELARRTGMRICGPNCAGIMNLPQRVAASFGSQLAADTTLVPGDIAIVSQSGAVGAYVFTLARERGIGLSSWVTTGNEADLQAADFIAALATDPATRVIALYLEQVRDGDAMIEACALARRNGKALVGILAGRSEASEQALRSHTAALAGDRTVARAALEELGVTLVDSIDALLATAVGLAAPARPQGKGVGIVTISGAAGIMMVDRCVELGLAVPELPANVQERLKALLPYAGTANPVDLTGNIANTPEIFEPFLHALLECEQIGSIVCFLGHVSLSPHVGARLIADLAAVASQTTKPVWLVGLLAGEPPAGVPRFTDPVQAIDVLAVAASERGQDVLGRRDAASDTLELDLPEHAALSEAESQRCLEPLGIAFPRQAVATTPEEAEAAARDLGGPVAMKILSPDIVHKTDVGGVQTGVTAPAAAFEAIVASVRRHAPDARIDGVLVQELVDGYPVIVGARLDPTFGPVVLVGSGGIHAEVIADQALALAPVDRAGAAALIDATKLPAVLDGARAGPPLSRPALEDTIVAVADAAWRARHRVAGIELNPVLLRPLDAIAVDALIETKRSADGA